MCFCLQVQCKKYVLNPQCFCVSPVVGGRNSLRNKYITSKKKLALKAKPNPSDLSHLQDKHLRTLTADSECG